jgi:hypothetical protein
MIRFLRVALIMPAILVGLLFVACMPKNPGRLLYLTPPQPLHTHLSTPSPLPHPGHPTALLRHAEHPCAAAATLHPSLTRAAQ